jgi:glycosyltransferase involved in cell wall biosynthesis
MRITHAVADGNPGGATSLVLDLIERQLQVRNAEVALLVQEDSYALDCARQLGARAAGLDFFRNPIDPRLHRDLGRALGHLPSDVLHVHGSRAGFCLGVRRERIAPSVYTVHGYHFLHRSLWQRRLGTLAERTTSRRADAIAFVCEHDRELARRCRLVPRRKPTRVIWNGIPLARVPAALDARPRSVGFCARLTQQKDPLLALEVAALLAPKGFQFTFIGGGDLEAEIRRRRDELRLQDDVHLLGSVSRDQALEALRHVQILLLTSRWEGMPITLIEAMQMGIPVVAARVSGIPELIEPGRSGILVDGRGAAEFAAAVERLAAETDLRRRLVERARQHVQQFDVATTEARYWEVYAEVARGRRRS